MAELVAAEVQWLSRLKHPGVLKVLEPLEETRSQFCFVTEEVTASLHNWLRAWDPIAAKVRDKGLVGEGLGLRPTGKPDLCSLLALKLTSPNPRPRCGPRCASSRWASSRSRAA